MNFLAHFQLAAPDLALMQGNYVADFLSNKDVVNLPTGIREGVRLHRAIDVFTDNHAANREVVTLLRPYYQKYAPVVADIFYDYFLCRQWAQFSTTPLLPFLDTCYEVINNLCVPTLPANLLDVKNRMVADRFLHHALSVEGIEKSMLRLQRRVKFPVDLSTAATVLRTHEAAIAAHFSSLYTDLQTFVGSWKADNPLT